MSTEGSGPMICCSLLVFTGNEKNSIIIVTKPRSSVCYIVSALNGINCLRWPSVFRSCLLIFHLFSKIPADQLLVTLNFKLTILQISYVF